MAFQLRGQFVVSDGVARVTSQTFVLAVLPRGGLSSLTVVKMTK